MESTQKALYIHFEDTENPQKSGVLNKIKGKTDAFKKFHISFDFISFKTKNVLCYNNREILRIPSRILFFRKFIFKRILRIINKQSYSFLYIRYFGCDHHFIQFLKEIQKKNLKVFLEFPTFPYDDEVKASNFIERCIINHDKKYRKELHKYVFKAISFTNIDEILKIQTIKLQNGIDFSELALIKPEKNNNVFNMIAVANISRWHAFDRLLMGMYHYFKNPIPGIDVKLKIIGGGKELNTLKKLCKSLDLNSYVYFKGSKKGDELDKEFENVHLAIGSLGLHRIGLISNSTLKIGEYTARGLASVIAYNDFSLNDSATFVLQIPADESAVDIYQLIAFFKNLSHTPEEIREYAKKYFSWETQVKKIVDLL